MLPFEDFPFTLGNKTQNKNALFFLNSISLSLLAVPPLEESPSTRGGWGGRRQALGQRKTYYSKVEQLSTGWHARREEELKIFKFKEIPKEKRRGGGPYTNISTDSSHRASTRNRTSGGAGAVGSHHDGAQKKKKKKAGKRKRVDVIVLPHSEYKDSFFFLDA